MKTANLPDDDEIRLCWSCVGEDFLRARIQNEGDEANCSFCGKTQKTLAIEELGNIFELAFKSHFRRTRPGMTELEEAQMRHGFLDWPPERDGEPIIEVLKWTAKISQEAAEAIRVELEGRFGTRDDYEMQNETEFDSETYYEELDGTAGDWHQQWSAFEKELRENSRYFSNDALATLRRVFDGICDLRTRSGDSVIVEAGPGKLIDALVRARVFHDREKMERALEHPGSEIGPPPSRLAKAGRMNPGGISTFYGSLDKKAAISEVRPVVGSSTVTARFLLVRNLRLLDLTSLSEVGLPGSVFDPGYIHRLERVEFLGHLGSKMILPVMPDDEIFEYLSTQVVCDFLAAQKDLSLDGIIYRSVQLGYEAKNIVLFHHASRVEEIIIPRGATISSGPTQMSDDEEDFEYRVTVTLPDDEFVVRKASSDVPDVKRDYEDFMEKKQRESELRPVTLKVDLDSLEVHEIESVLFKTSEYKVTRHEWQPSKLTKFSRKPIGSELLDDSPF